MIPHNIIVWHMYNLEKNIFCGPGYGYVNSVGLNPRSVDWYINSDEINTTIYTDDTNLISFGDPVYD